MEEVDLAYKEKLHQVKKKRIKAASSIAIILVLLSGSMICLIWFLYPPRHLKTRKCKYPIKEYVGISGIVFAIYVLLAVLITWTKGRPTAIYKRIVSIVCVLGIGWSITGLIWSSGEGCAQNLPGFFTIAMMTSCILFFTCIPILILILYYSLCSISPEDEQAPLLIYARCSCLSLKSKRRIAIAPFIIMSIANLILLILKWNEKSSRPFREYMFISWIIISIYCLVSLWIFYGHDQTRASTKPLFLIIFCCLASIAWGIVGTRWMSSSSDYMMDGSNLSSTLSFLNTMLFVLGIGIISLTICCKTERFLMDPLLDSNQETITIDSDML